MKAASSSSSQCPIDYEFLGGVQAEVDHLKQMHGPALDKLVTDFAERRRPRLVADSDLPKLNGIGDAVLDAIAVGADKVAKFAESAAAEYVGAHAALEDPKQPSTF